MHLELGEAGEEPRPREGCLVLLVVADDVADVLAEEALDALAELLASVDVDLRHAVDAVRPLRTGSERRDAPRHGVVVRHVGDEVAHHGKGAHRRDRHGLVRRQRRHPGHAHEPGPTVHLRAAGAALAGLAVPAHSEIRRELGLHTVHDVENDLALLGGERVVLECAAVRVAPPNAQRHLRGAGLEGSRHQWSSSKSAFSAVGISGSGSALTVTSPSCSEVVMLSAP